MPLASNDGFWFDPKFVVAGIALAAVGLLLSYDMRLGLAAGALLLLVLAAWLYLALRYGSLSGAPSVRTSIVESARQHEVNRRAAEKRTGLHPLQRPPELP